MIGTTTLKYRSTTKIEGKKDLRLQPLVWLLAVFLLMVSGPTSIAQTKPGTKSKAPVAAPAEKEVVEKEAAPVDDNGNEESEDEDAEESAAVVEDNGETTENLNTEKAAAQAEEEKLAGDEEEETEAPQEEVVEVADPDPEPVPTPDPPAIAEMEEKTEKAPVAKPAPAPPKLLPVQPVAEIPQEKVTEADMVDVIPKEKNVEVELRKRYTNYRDRRTTHGFLFNVSGENLYFPDYASIIDGELYESMFGQEDVTLVQIQMGYKFNFFLGSLTAGGGFGQGSLIDDRLQVSNNFVERELTIQKKSIHAQWMLDSILREPYFVPYVGFSMWQLSLSETGISSLPEDGGQKIEYSMDTGNGTALTVGFLVQLNWLEPETARVAYMGQGLENTYLDVFWTQYQNTDNELDPSFENDFNFGVGLRLEF